MVIRESRYWIWRHHTPGSVFMRPKFFIRSGEVNHLPLMGHCFDKIFHYRRYYTYDEYFLVLHARARARARAR